MSKNMREGGALFVDSTAPRTTEASLTIIAHLATVLTAAKQTTTPTAAKVWSDESTSIAKIPYLFNSTQLDFSNLENIYKNLARLSSNRNSFVIRGALVDPFNTNNIRRLIHAKKNDVPTVKDTPLSWCAFDIDGITTPYNITTDPEQAVKHFISEHLPMFVGVGFVWKLSGSAGHPSKNPFELRSHLYFILSDARTSAQVKTWCTQYVKKGLIDLALFNPVQPHYTADPVTRYCDHDDPCKIRLGLIDGSPFAMPLVFVEDVRPKIELSHKTQRKIAAFNASSAFSNTYSKGAARAHLERVMERVRYAQSGTRQNTLNAQAYYIYAYMDAGLLSELEITDGLYQAALANGLSHNEIMATLDAKRGHHAAYVPQFFTPSDVDELPDPIPEDTRPTYTTADVFYKLISEDNEQLPRNVDGCLIAFSETTDPHQAAKLIVWAHYLAAHGTPYKYQLEAVHAQINAMVGNKVHPITVKASYRWAQGIVQFIKVRALESVAISDRFKRQHIYTPTNDLSKIIHNPRARVQLLQAATGTGKTSKVGRALSDECKKNGARFAAISYLTSLVTELANVLNTTHYQNVKGDDKGVFRSMSSVLNSIVNPFIKSCYERPDVLFIDEGAQMLRALVAIYNGETSVSAGNTPQDVYDALVFAIRNAKRVVVADAGLNDEFVEWIESILDTGERIEIIEHNTKSGDGVYVTVNFNHSLLNAQYAGIAAIKEAVAKGKRVWVSVESVKVGRAIELALKPLAKVFFLHGQTPTEDKEKILKDVDNESLKYQVFIASPAIKSGISVTHRDNSHFDTVFYFGDGSTCSPMDTLQMIRRVRYVTDIQIYTWGNHSKLGDNSKIKVVEDFHTLKNKLQNNMTWEKHNFNAALCHCLEHSGFNVSYHAVNGDIRASKALSQQVRTDMTNALNAAVTLNVSEYRGVLQQHDKTAEDWNALKRFELCEHLAVDGEISEADFKHWQDGRGREVLAKRAALRGIVLPSVEHSPVYVDMFLTIFEGVDVLTLAKLDRPTAQRIVDNALKLGSLGVQYGLLPQSFRRKNLVISDPMKTAKLLLKSVGCVTHSPFYYKQNVESVTAKRNHHRGGYLVNHEQGQALDVIINRLLTQSQTVTTPLTDKNARRDFDLPPAANEPHHTEDVPQLKSVDCQDCTHLTSFGTCRKDEPICTLDGSKKTCVSFDMIYHDRKSVTTVQQKAIVKKVRHEGELLVNHLYKCSQCDFEHDDFCFDGHSLGISVLDGFAALNSAASKNRFIELINDCKLFNASATEYLFHTQMTA